MKYPERQTEKLPAAGRVQREKRCYDELSSRVCKEVKTLKTVLLIMRRASLAQGLMAKARDDPDLRLCYEPDYDHVDAAIRSHQAAGALLEVSEDGRQDMGFCLSLCARLRETAPRCRLMLMCPEGQAETIRLCIEAKRRGKIDDFVFYDVSLDYLIASLKSL